MSWQSLTWKEIQRLRRMTYKQLWNEFLNRKRASIASPLYQDNFRKSMQEILSSKTQKPANQ